MKTSPQPALSGSPRRGRSERPRVAGAVVSGELSKLRFLPHPSLQESRVYTMRASSSQNTGPVLAWGHKDFSSIFPYGAD
ncbi:unnamed protein product [Caretta caretta]